MQNNNVFKTKTKTLDYIIILNIKSTTVHFDFVLLININIAHDYN